MLVALAQYSEAHEYSEDATDGFKVAEMRASSFPSSPAISQSDCSPHQERFYKLGIEAEHGSGDIYLQSAGQEERASKTPDRHSPPAPSKHLWLFVTSHSDYATWLEAVHRGSALEKPLWAVIRVLEGALF